MYSNTEWRSTDYKALINLYLTAYICRAGIVAQLVPLLPQTSDGLAVSVLTLLYVCWIGMFSSCCVPTGYSSLLLQSSHAVGLIGISQLPILYDFECVCPSDPCLVPYVPWEKLQIRLVREEQACHVHAVHSPCTNVHVQN